MEEQVVNQIVCKAWKDVDKIKEVEEKKKTKSHVKPQKKVKQPPRRQESILEEQVVNQIVCKAWDQADQLKKKKEKVKTHHKKQKPRRQESIMEEQVVNSIVCKAWVEADKLKKKKDHDREVSHIHHEQHKNDEHPKWGQHHVDQHKNEDSEHHHHHHEEHHENGPHYLQSTESKEMKEKLRNQETINPSKWSKNLRQDKDEDVIEEEEWSDSSASPDKPKKTDIAKSKERRSRKQRGPLPTASKAETDKENPVHLKSSPVKPAMVDHVKDIVLASHPEDSENCLSASPQKIFNSVTKRAQFSPSPTKLTKKAFGDSFANVEE